MSKDVEMKEDAADAASAAAKPEKAEPAPLTLEQVLDSNVALLRKAVATRETRLLVGRLLRQTATVRGQFSAEAFEAFFQRALPEGSAVRPLILAAVSQASSVRLSALVWRAAPDRAAGRSPADPAASQHPWAGVQPVGGLLAVPASQRPLRVPSSA